MLIHMLFFSIFVFKMGRKKKHKTIEESLIAHRLADKKWRDNNKEKIKALNKITYIKHKEKIIERNNKWIKNNPEKVKERRKRWVKKNPEKRRKTLEKYRKANPEKVKEWNKRYNENNKDKRKKYKNKYEKIENVLTHYIDYDVMLAVLFIKH